MNEQQKAVINEAKQEAAAFFKHADPAHDFWHTERVAKQAVALGKETDANLYVVELTAWLHDIADKKLNSTEEEGLNNVRHWLSSHGVESDIAGQVMDIIETMSFRNGTNKAEMKTIEGKVVQDADRLDAMGAIGIARAFAYSGTHGKPLHEPASADRKDRDTAIQHFFDKLLRLKSLMNTEEAKKLAHHRQRFMVSYLEQFYSEWEQKL
ncbi:HD domain-containing protein [Sinobaca sp. H24]|uniref:HD domain-containing protein n=1 Tax=Sinobaca sp. H24 TaxID=2923376 RepID=UPI00207A1249|nr:HD domain-containing protein [Sinobaca sp. H24]